MQFQDYQERASETAVYPSQGEIYGLAYAALGLNGEAGEVAEHAKKALRDDQGTISDERREKIIKELGDTLWYAAAVANEIGVSLATVAEMNLAKLKARKEQDKIHGEGDDREDDEDPVKGERRVDPDNGAVWTKIGSEGSLVIVREEGSESHEMNIADKLWQQWEEAK